MARVFQGPGGSFALVGAVGVSWAVLKASRVVWNRLQEEKLLSKYREVCNVPAGTLQDIEADFGRSAEAGLRGDESGLDMLPTFIDILPSGEETGSYYAIDLGGTNFRVLWVKLGSKEQDTLERPIPSDCFDTDSGRLLEFVADCIEEMLEKRPPENGQIPVIGFCFSFGAQQTALDNGALVRWTKGFYGSGLLGKNIVAELKATFDRRNRKVHIPAILNDTAATLVALRFADPATEIGVILGTGTNAAYRERVTSIRTLPADYAARSERMVINTEWGDFWSDTLPVLPGVDDAIDAYSVNPGHGRLEKLISGHYMGEIVRLMLLQLARKQGSFSAAHAKLAKRGAVSSASVSAMDDDESSEREPAKATLRVLGIRAPTQRQLRIVEEVAKLVGLRSARLAAVALFALLRHMGWDGRARIAVAVDGSVYCRYRRYRTLMREAMRELVGDDSVDLIQLVEVKDGSVLGAAYLAAACDVYEQTHPSQMTDAAASSTCLSAT